MWSDIENKLVARVGQDGGGAQEGQTTMYKINKLQGYVVEHGE